jgi:hypothetical protein
MVIATPIIADSPGRIDINGKQCHTPRGAHEGRPYAAA